MLWFDINKVLTYLLIHKKVMVSLYIESLGLFKLFYTVACFNNNCIISIDAVVLILCKSWRVIVTEATLLLLLSPMQTVSNVIVCRHSQIDPVLGITSSRECAPP